MDDAATYRVPGMTCEHCRVAVTGELSAVSGVGSVSVDLDAKLVNVSGTSLDDAALRAAIDEAGFEAAVAFAPMQVSLAHPIGAVEAVGCHVVLPRKAPGEEDSAKLHQSTLATAVRKTP